MLAALDERERNAEAALFGRYAQHHKSPKMSKMINRKKEEQKIRQAFSGEKKQDTGLAQRIKAVNDYFMKKFKD